MSWNGSGLPSSRRAISSPSSTAVRTRSVPSVATTSGQPAGDLVQGAGEQANLAARQVGLDPDPVELPLHRGRLALADLGQRFGDARRAGRQHRPHWPADLQPERAQRLAPAGQRRGRHRPQRAAQHHGPAYVGGRHRGGAGHRVGHHPFQRALAQLTGQQPGQELLLGPRGPAEQLTDQGPPRRRRPLPGHRADRREGRVHLGQAQCRRGRGREPVLRCWPGGTGPQNLPQGRPADPDLPLRQLSGQVPDRDRHLQRPGRTQRAGQ